MWISLWMSQQCKIKLLNTLETSILWSESVRIWNLDNFSSSLVFVWQRWTLPMGCESDQWPKLEEAGDCSGLPNWMKPWASWRDWASVWPRWQPSLKESRVSPCASLPEGACSSHILFSIAAQWCILVLLATSTGPASCWHKVGGSLSGAMAGTWSTLTLPSLRASAPSWSLALAHWSQLWKEGSQIQNLWMEQELSPSPQARLSPHT